MRNSFNKLVELAIGIAVLVIAAYYAATALQQLAIELAQGILVLIGAYQ